MNLKCIWQMWNNLANIDKSMIKLISNVISLWVCFQKLGNPQFSSAPDCQICDHEWRKKMESDWGVVS